MTTNPFLLKKSFVPKLLFIDHDYVRTQYKATIESLNTFPPVLKLLPQIFDKPLTTDQTLRILKGNFPVVSNLLVKECPINNIVLERYIELKGIERLVTELKNALRLLPAWNDAVFKFSGDVVEVHPNYLKELEKTNTHYSKHPLQNEFLEVATEISNAINKAFDKGILQIPNSTAVFGEMGPRKYISHMTNILAVENDRIIPNGYAIWQMRFGDETNS